MISPLQSVKLEAGWMGAINTHLTPNHLNVGASKMAAEEYKPARLAPTKRMRPIVPDAETTEWFWARVQTSEGCWNWIGSLAHGYGQIQRGRFGRRLLAHRYSWTLHNGEIPKGLVVCHKCDNPRCVRPDHLFIGTQRDNNHDAQRKGRLAVESKGWKREITHCPQGHAYDEANTYHGVQRTGKLRTCRTCNRIRGAEYYARNREVCKAKQRAYNARMAERRKAL